MKCRKCGNELRPPAPLFPPWPFCETCNEFTQLNGDPWGVVIEHVVLDHEEDWDTPSFTVDADGHQLPMGKIAELEESCMRRKGA